MSALTDTADSGIDKTYAGAGADEITVICASIARMAAYDAAISSGLPPARPMARFSVSGRSCVFAMRKAAHDLVGFFLNGNDLGGPRRFLSERRKCQSGKA
ncbi:hypothetical protein A8B74_18280 [Sulfitobacter geojensis]|nr:hypothetical protein A8B74_18280 [Sulfitobacter geojensis]